MIFFIWTDKTELNNIFIVYNSVFLLLQKQFSILLEFHGIVPYSYFKFNNHGEIETNTF